MPASIRELIEAVYKGISDDPALLDGVLAENWEDVPLQPGQETGPAGGRYLNELLNKVFSDVSFAVDEIIDGRGDDGNGMVAVRATLFGVHTGEFLGIEPTGRKTKVRTHDFHEVVDGRIVCTHHMEDWLGWFQQVGSWPAN